MAPRRSAATEVLEEEEEPQLTALKFDEPLSWRAGRAIPTTDLLRRLEALAEELREMDQDEVDKDSLTKVAKELAGQNLMGHKDRGVRAFTACCLVDVLKLCAPDAPFTEKQLIDIFTLLIMTIIPALSDPSNAYNVQHTYVLTSLSEVKSVVLLTDIPNSDGLLLHLFSYFFDIISGTSKASTGEQISKNVEHHMNGILVTLVDESQSLSIDIVDTIMAQFLRAASMGRGKSKVNGDAHLDEKQSTLLMKELPAAYRMAEFICNSCTEKMARYISQYFTDVIMEASEAGRKLGDRRRSNINVESDDEDGPAGPTEQDLKELIKAHRLLRELWRASPKVLQNVIPQLEAELSAENIQLRLLATETLGDIISGIGAAGPPSPPVTDASTYPPIKLADYPESPNYTSILTTPLSPQSFSQTHPAVYHSFIGRKNDKSPLIRSAWTIAIGRILSTLAGGVGISREEEIVLVNGLAEKLNDADERVRIAAVKAVGNFGFRHIMTKLGISGDVEQSGSVLGGLADRARDRKHAVRVEAMTVISKIWGAAAGEVLAGNRSVIAMLGAIPSKIFDAFYTNDPDVNVLLDHVMFEQLIPLSYPPPKSKAAKQANGDSQASLTNGDGPFDADKIRTERILTMIKWLDTKSKRAFFALQARQNSYREVLLSFLKRCEEYNGGVMEENAKVIKERLTQVIQWLASMLPDRPRATADLWKYAKLHDRRSYQLIRFAIAYESDFKTVFKAIKEFSKRIEAAPGAPAGILETLTPLIYRGGSLAYNRSHLPAILEFSRSDGHGLGATAHEVLNEISQRNPQIFKAQVKELCKLLQDQAPTATKSNDLGSVETLKACAGFARKFPEEIVCDRKFIQALISFAKYGEPAKAAKYAVTILMAASDRKEMHAKDLLQKSMKDWAYGEDHFLTKLAAISQLTLIEPRSVDETANDNIVEITTQQILLQARTPPMDDDRTWQDDASLDEECQAKCWALKIVVNQLRTVTDPESIRTVATPVLKLLNALVFKEGEILKLNSTPKHHKSRLRLTAAKLLLKLCTHRAFDALVTPTAFDHLATVAQDITFQVRRGFVEKVQKYLVQDRLPNRFYSIVFLVAFEPDMQFQQTTITWIKSRAKVFQEKKSIVLEGIMARLLSLLAHHPDYSPNAEDLKDTARYIMFYLTSVGNEDNTGLIYKFAERVKQVRDAIKPGASENLYVLSDLATAIIRKWQEKKGWVMQSHAGRIGLSKDLFTQMPNHDAAQAVAEKQYLPDDMEDILNDLIRTADKRKHKRKSDDNVEKPSAKKQRSAPSAKTPTKETTIRRSSKAKTPGKPIKKAKLVSSSSSAAASNITRRRSGRGAGAKSYADRDSSEDEEEMMKGVSKWEYTDGHIEPDAGDEEMRDSSIEVESATADDQGSESEAEQEEDEHAGIEPDEEPAEEKEAGQVHSEPSPEPEVETTALPAAKANGRAKKVPLRGKAAVAAKAVPAKKAGPLPSPAKVSVAAKAKAKPKGSGTGRGKSKATAPVKKDVYAFDESD